MAQSDRTGALAPRHAALSLVQGVRAGRGLADQVADRTGPLAALSGPDRARAQRLASTLFRHRARADRVIDTHVARPPHETVRHILRLGVIELCLEGEAAHGVVDSYVALTRQVRQVKAAGLVNAVLRKVAAEPADFATLPAPKLPAPIRKRVVRDWGAAAAARIEAAHLVGARLDITPKPGVDLAEALGAEVLPTGSLRLAEAGQVQALPGYGDGDWWVQDAAAALPAKLLAPRPGERIADLCAAPGGKTLQLAAAGATVTAVDASADRLARLGENLARCRVEAEIVTADATTWGPEGSFDAVLVDAPCSATGTIRRHPDLPFARSFVDLDALLALQAALIDAGARLLKPGGRLVYCTCSLFKAEGERQWERALARHPGATPLEAAAIPGLPAEWIAGPGMIRTRPDFWAERQGIDGFFMAGFRKAADPA